MARRPTQCDSIEESIDREDIPEPHEKGSLAAQKRTRERFHQGMPKIEFADQSPIFRPTALYLSIVERGMLSATAKITKLNQEAKDDIHQETWLYLLEDLMRLPWVATAKELFDLGQYMALHQHNALYRDDPDSKPKVFSQMKLKSVECEDSVEEILPFDWVDLTAQGAREPVVEDILYAARRDTMNDVLRAVSLADRRFLTRYETKLRRHTPAQRKRYQRLKERLKREGHDLMSQ